MFKLVNEPTAIPSDENELAEIVALTSEAVATPLDENELEEIVALTKDPTAAPLLEKDASTIVIPLEPPRVSAAPSFAVPVPSWNAVDMFLTQNSEHEF